MKRFILVVLSICLMAAVSSFHYTAQGEEGVFAAKGEEIKDKTAISISNNHYQLTVDPVTCYFTVEQLADHVLWRSNPDHPKDDAYANGMTKTNLMSQLVVTYTTENATQRDTNNYASSIARRTYKLYQLDNGVRIDFVFEREGFVIPVAYHLEEDGFRASILFSEIQENSKNKVNNIEFLPYFGTASQQDTGYLFVPDGSGALIRLNNGKTEYPAYEKDIYGKDPVLVNMYETSRQQSIKIPVFGMKKNDNAFLAVIENGDAQGKLKASVSGKTSGYNTIYPVAVYRVADRIYLLDQLSGNKDVIYNALNPVPAKSFDVKYYFLSGNRANYSGMAVLYRTLLEKNGLKSKTDGKPRLYVDFYGGVLKNKSFLGFRYMGKEKLTSFEDAVRILGDLKNNGVSDIAAGYRCYSDDYFSSKAEVGLKAAAFLGGTRGWKKLLSYAKGNSVALYPYVDFFSFDKAGNSFSKFFDVSRSLDLGPALIPRKDLNTNIKSTKKPAYYLLKPSKYSEAVKKIFGASEKYELDTLLLGQISHSLSSDFDIGGWQREKAKAELSAQYEYLSKSKALMLSAPNAYLLNYASCITDAALSSSQNLLFDQEVPFLQMLLKGNVDYSGSPVNLNDSSEDAFLKHIESGSNLKYAFMESEGKVLLRTNLDYLYGAHYENFKTQAIERYQELVKISGKIKDAKIESHQYQEGLTRVAYSNGTVIYVNYNNRDIVADGVTIPKKWYAVHEEE